MSFLEKAWDKDQSLGNFAFSDFLCIIILHIEIINAMKRMGQYKAANYPCIHYWFIFLSLSPSLLSAGGLLLLFVFHGGHPSLFQDSPTPAHLTGWARAGHCSVSGIPSMKRMVVHVYPPVSEVGSDSQVSAMDTRKHLQDTRGSPGLGSVVRNHNLAAL